MQMLTALCNVILAVLTCAIIVTDAPPSKAPYLVFTRSTIAAKAATVRAIADDAAGGGRAARTPARRRPASA